MHFINAGATIFSKSFYIFLPTKSWKTHPQKLLRKTQIHFFFLTALTVQTTQTEEFMFQNVAYRPTVYRTGPSGILEEFWLQFVFSTFHFCKNRWQQTSWGILQEFWLKFSCHLPFSIVCWQICLFLGLIFRLISMLKIEKYFIPGGIRTRDLWIRSPTRYPLRYGDFVITLYLIR